MGLKADINAEKGPLYERIKAAIRQRIVSGEWAVGYRLPTLRQLSQEVDVAYATVERAVRELVDEGLLEGRKRGGTLVAERRKQLKGAIGIIGDTPYGRLFTASRYFSTLLMFLQQHVIDRQRMVIYDHRQEDQPLEAMFNHMSLIDGAIVFDPANKQDSVLRKLRKSGLPIVVISERHKSPVPNVISDSAADTTAALEVLQKQGHKRIAHVTHSFMSDGPTATLRRDTWRKVVGSHVKDIDKLAVIGDIEEQARGLLAMKPAPTALYVPQSRHFPDLYKLLKGTPIEPGKHLAICTYDENLWNTITPLHIEFMSIEQRLSVLGEKAVQMLISMVDNPSTKPKSQMIRSQLMHVRASGMREMIV